MMSINRLRPSLPMRRMCVITALELAPDPQQTSNMYNNSSSMPLRRRDVQRAGVTRGRHNETAVLYSLIFSATLFVLTTV